MSTGIDAQNQSPARVILALGGRYKATRIALQITQQEVADKTGISITTIRRFENGLTFNLTLAHFIALLQAIGFADNLEDIIPEILPDPNELFRLQNKQRKRASHGKRSNG
ncbi:MAG: helix-turn-helix domain-containing protein [Muribaculaceae bacterium]|nr:helix-turn-helix domain-containing protein [Muribaculaceae bacterium]